MATQLLTCEKELNEIHEILRFSKKTESIIYKLLNKFFKPEYNIKINQSNQFAYEVIINAIITLQAISLFWYPNLDISGWKSWEKFWKFIGYLNYGSLCEELGITKFCFYGTTSVLIAELLFLIIFGALYFSKKPSKIFYIFPRYIIRTFSTICFIPSLLIHLVVFKYSIIKQNYIEEYGTKMDSQSWQYDTKDVVFSVTCIFTIIIINFLYEILSCDMQHSHHSKNLKARSHSDLNLQIKIFFIGICLFYVSFGKENIIYLQILAVLFSLFLVIKCVTVLQYFNMIENCIQACKMMAISASLLIFIFGEIMDNSIIIIIFNIILQPILGYSISKVVAYNYPKLSKTLNFPTNQLDFEKKFRHLLIDEKIENEIDILDFFQNYSKLDITKNKIFIIWEFNYCFSIKKDERLARVLLSKISKEKSSFEGNFQEWKIFKMLDSKKCKQFPDVKYLEFLKEFNEIESKDQELCFIITQFQCEFASKNPKLEKIMKLAENTAKNIKKITKGYNKLIETNKNGEIYDHYAGFLGTIANSPEEARTVHLKKNTISFNYQHSEYQNLENYRKTIGILLVSCSPDNFGAIIFANEKAAQHLKISVEHAYGLHLVNFIPYPFSDSHGALIKDFYLNCKATELTSHKSLCLQTNDGFLIECYIMIKLTALYNQSYYLISFKPRSKNREIALVSNENIIINHSSLFVCHLNTTLGNIKDKPLNEIVPNLYIDKMQVYKPYYFNVFGKEIAFVHAKKDINSSFFHFLLVTNNQKEIQRWKIGDDELEVIESQANTTGENFCPIKIEDTSVNNPKDHYNNFYIKSGDKETEFLTRNGSLSPTDYSSKIDSKSLFFTGNYKIGHISHTQQLLLKSKQKIRVLQWVLFIVMCSAIITMIGILVYIITDVSHTSKMSSLGQLGKLLYSLEAIPDWAETLDKQSKNTNMSQTQKDENIEYFLELMNKLDDIRNNLMNEFEEWGYCKSSEIIKKPQVPFWNFDGEKPIIDYDNLWNVITKVSNTGRHMLNDIMLNQEFAEHTQFLYMNCITYIFYYTNKTDNDIVNCEIDRVTKTGENINLLIILGALVFWLLFFVIIWFIILASKSHDEFWNFVLDNAQSSMSRLKSLSIERLQAIHKINYIFEENLVLSLKKNHKLKSNLYINFIWRALIFLLIATSYYYMLYFHMLPACKYLIVKRPMFLDNFNIRRALISRLSMFSKEIMNPYMISIFKDSYNFPNPHISANHTARLLELKIEELENENFSVLMSNELLRKIYENNNEIQKNILDYGSVAAINEIINGMQDLALENEFSTVELYQYSAKAKLVQDELWEEFLLADYDSKNIINSYLGTIIIITVLYSLAIGFLFFFYYIPFFNCYAKKLSRFSIITKVLSVDTQ